MGDLGQVIKLSGPLFSLFVKWHYLLISLGLVGSSNRWRTVMETVPESTDLQEDCCLLMKATQGDSSQLRAHLVFPSANPLEASSMRPVRAKPWSLAKGVQSPSSVRHFFANLLFGLMSDIFSMSLRVSSGAKWFAATSSPFPN